VCSWAVILGSIATGIIIAAALLVMVQALSGPLSTMKDVSKQIVAMTSEEFRHYGECVPFIEVQAPSYLG
jgi:hypothetical protein